MEKYKIITYTIGRASVVCYILNEKIYLSQKEMAKLFNRTISTISKTIKTLEKGNSRFAKTKIVTGNQKTILYGLDYATEIAKTIGDFSIFDFQKWVVETLKQESLNLQNDYKIVRFNQDNAVILDVRVSPSQNTVFLNQDQLAELYDTSKQLISYHIKNILDEEELERATVKEILTVQNEGDRAIARLVTYYNLDMIISIGYRINSKRGITFRRWSSTVLRDYLIKGYAIDNERSLTFKDNYYNLVNQVVSLNNKYTEHDQRINKLEHQFDNSVNEMIIKNGMFFDAMSLLQELCSNANSRIILVDPYADSKALNIFNNKKDDVDVLVVTSSLSKLSKEDVNAFIKQYGAITSIHNDDLHDRYLFIDDKAYHLGTSINYLGKRISQIDELKDTRTIGYLLLRILQ